MSKQVAFRRGRVYVVGVTTLRPPEVVYAPAGTGRFAGCMPLDEAVDPLMDQQLVAVAGDHEVIRQLQEMVEARVRRALDQDRAGYARDDWADGDGGDW